MRIIYEKVKEGEEEVIIVRCKKVTEDMTYAARTLNAVIGGVTAYKDGEIYKLPLCDIYYFEVVDSNAFLYCENEVYESKLKLYEFEELTYGTHFFRATKSTVINADRITCVSPALYGRFTATLDNGEKVMVSRSYVSSLKRIMGL
ncbi:MAG: LytTR family transcriptional regulator DNA-binding domain-containing protein [Clostridia bacterium]|nr:LytTR family transcriptional regulator DNA-binding domain-containing protein [Clostridia bacterium]